MVSMPSVLQPGGGQHLISPEEPEHSSRVSRATLPGLVNHRLKHDAPEKNKTIVCGLLTADSEFTHLFYRAEPRLDSESATWFWLMNAE